jgi:hypothetical protein
VLPRPASGSQNPRSQQGCQRVAPAPANAGDAGGVGPHGFHLLKHRDFPRLSHAFLGMMLPCPATYASQVQNDASSDNERGI